MFLPRPLPTLRDFFASCACARVCVCVCAKFRPNFYIGHIVQLLLPLTYIMCPTASIIKSSELISRYAPEIKLNPHCDAQSKCAYMNVFSFANDTKQLNCRFAYELNNNKQMLSECTSTLHTQCGVVVTGATS